MQKLLTTGAWILLVTSLAACDGPMGPIAGGALKGEATDWPADWAFSEAIENVLVETNPEDPYSVTLWGVSIEDRFYIAGASAESRWVANLLANPELKIKVGEMLISARASRVIANSEIQAVLARYVDKYEMDASEEADFIEDGGILFRLTSR